MIKQKKHITLFDKIIELNKQGYVYILIHPTQYGYLKIGETGRTPEERAKELTQLCKTGLVGRYTVAYSLEIDNAKLVESIVHQKLRRHRVSSDREFFHYELKAAIKVIEDVVEKLKTQSKIDFDELERNSDKFVSESWWNGLSPSWQQVFKKYIKRKFTPGKEDLFKGVYMVIGYSRKNEIRKSIADLISDKNEYSKGIEKWYQKLSKDEKDEINTFIPRAMTKTDLKKILNLKEIDCSGNLLIENLIPISEITNLKVLNCSNTSVSILEPIKELLDLKEIRFDNTEISSLKPLENLKKLKKIYCNQTALSEEEIERFKEINPKCEILNNPFKT